MGYSWTSQLDFSTGRGHINESASRQGCVCESVLDCVYAVQRGMNHFYLSFAHQTPPTPTPSLQPPPPLSMHHPLPNCFPSLVTLRRYLKTPSPCFSSFPLCVFLSLSHPFSLKHTHTSIHPLTHVPLDLISEAVYLAGRKKT